ncbi:MAG: helix-turn-helix transcriptional regulator [Saprospiraceae bacterium]|nr:helix-turn-helix transcriptional regulator [Saprospiraceae bacterium]
MPQQVIDGKQIGRTRLLVTSRENEILDLISLGFSTDEIAEDLFLSSETVRTHRKSLLQKFKARNTAQLIRIAFEFGVLRVSL